jgi:hypothetical protein
MANPVHNPPADVLTAYIDGELDADARRAVDAVLVADADTRARLEALKASQRPFKESFELVTEAAPRERLQATLAGIAPPRAEHGAPRGFWMSAAAVMLFAAGVAIGNSDLIAPPPGSPTAASKIATPDAVTRNNTPFAIQAQDQLALAEPKAATTSNAAPSATASDTARQAGRAVLDQAPAAAELAPAKPADAVPAQRTQAPPSGIIAAAPPPSPAPAAPTTTPSSSAATSQAFGGLAANGPAAPGASATAGAAQPSIAAAPPPAAAGAVGGGAVAALTTPTWRQVVSDYIVLTTADTLSVMPENPRLRDAVAAYGNKLQLDLSGNRLSVPMASLKDVRLYDYRGRPLVEASFLADDRMSVVSLCIILTMQADAPIGFETRNGQNIVFWTAGGHSFMLAGRASREALEAIARDLAVRFS